MFFFYSLKIFRLYIKTYIKTSTLPPVAPPIAQRSLHLSRRSPTIFSAAMENRCSSFILSRFSGCILKLILRTMLTTSSGTVVGGVGFLGLPPVAPPIAQRSLHLSRRSPTIFSARRSPTIFSARRSPTIFSARRSPTYSQLEDLLQYS